MSCSYIQPFIKSHGLLRWCWPLATYKNDGWLSMLAGLPQFWRGFPAVIWIPSIAGLSPSIAIFLLVSPQSISISHLLSLMINSIYLHKPSIAIDNGNLLLVKKMIPIYCRRAAASWFLKAAEQDPTLEFSQGLSWRLTSFCLTEIS